MKNGFFCLSANKVNKWGEIGDWINIPFQPIFFASTLFIFKRKNCLKTQFIKKHIKVFCVEKDKKENIFFLCELSFFRQSVCWNHLIHELNFNYPVISGAPFSEALLGQLLPCCCLQGPPALPGQAFGRPGAAGEAPAPGRANQPAVPALCCNRHWVHHQPLLV